MNQIVTILIKINVGVLPLVKFGRLTVSTLSEGVHIGEYILYLTFRITYVLLE